MRTIKYIVLHCTATSPKATVKSILDYWKAPKPKGCGWKSPGYHHLIEANGTVHNLLPIEQISNGVAGYNANSIHISYIGGIDDKGTPLDTRTEVQKRRQIELLNKYKKMFPGAVIRGHRDFPGVKKACPSFDVASWLKTIS